MIMKDNLTIAVIGLGYVGLPLASAFARKYKVIGFDKNIEKINMYKRGIDVTHEIGNQKIKKSKIIFSSDEKDLVHANVYIIAVPTPIDSNKAPYISDTIKATKTIGNVLKKGDLVVYESTFYPGMTEEICIPLLEEVSNMNQKGNFYVGYSPERINPGDKKHKLENITKLVSGIDKESTEHVYNIYKKILKRKPFIVSSIKIAESAKVLENTQRDVNIALMNDMSRFLKRMNIDTSEVLKACSTKWNFVNFRPGLVGGHCIGIDPYYLLYKANKLGVTLNVVKQCRESNEEMKDYIYNNFLDKVNKSSKVINRSVIIYGITFKENVSDYRNSKIVEIAKKLEENNFRVYVEDVNVNLGNLNKEYNTNFLLAKDCKEKVQGIIIASPHDEYKNIKESELIRKLENRNCPIFDLNNVIKKDIDSKVWGI